MIPWIVMLAYDQLSKKQDKTILIIQQYVHIYCQCIKGHPNNMCRRIAGIAAHIVAVGQSP